MRLEGGREKDTLLGSDDQGILAAAPAEGQNSTSSLQERYRLDTSRQLNHPLRQHRCLWLTWWSAV